MSYQVGTVIRSGFSTGATEAMTVNRAVYGGSTDFSSLISFVAGVEAGDYDIVFTPAAAGDYRARWTGNTSGEEFTGNWSVDAAAPSDPFAAHAADYADTASIGYKIRVLAARAVRGNG